MMSIETVEFIFLDLVRLVQEVTHVGDVIGKIPIRIS